MRHARYTLLLTFLIAAIAAQRVVGPVLAARWAEPAPAKLSLVARQLARRLYRRESRLAMSAWAGTTLALRKLETHIIRLVSAVVAHAGFEPFYFRLPPPLRA